MPTPLLIWVAAVIALAALSWWDRRKVPPNRAAWGDWPSDERDFTLIARYARDRAARPPALLDDRTWADLNMDDVFRLLDRAESLVGQQVLYGRLRSVPVGQEIEAFDALVGRLSEDAGLRATVRAALGRMRRCDGHDLHWLIQPGSFEAARWHVVFP